MLDTSQSARALPRSHRWAWGERWRALVAVTGVASRRSRRSPPDSGRCKQRNGAAWSAAWPVGAADRVPSQKKAGT